MCGVLAAPVLPTINLFIHPSSINHPSPPGGELGKGEIGVPRVRMGSKGEGECSPVDEEGREGVRDVGPEEPR